MKAVILVGGEGTRLRPLTCNITKAMVPIVNRPFLEHVICYLKKHGIEEIILAMGYMSGSIQEYFGDGSQLGVHLTYLVEKSPLGTAGAVKNAESFLGEAFFVFNGDTLSEIDLTAMMKRHLKIKPKASIALAPVDNPTIYGVVETDARGRVKRFVEKPSWDEVTSNMVNAGIYILEPEVLKHIPVSAHCMFENYLFPLLLKMGESVLGYPSDAYWIDIGTPEKYLKANHDLLKRRFSRGLQTEGKSEIHHEARIEGTVLVAEECIIAEGANIKGAAVLGPRCKVAKGAVIEGAVLWHDAKVEEEAVLRNCIIGSCCCIQQGSHILDNCVLGDNVTVGRGNKLANGARVWPDRYLEPNTISF